ncbi:hypothetical protein DPEC_G00029370 [Dallia pectoralis]|uniref:Uncharacterized protein n=1 Tax=Dallia pectoralis TaxID=75939 RepID=A0ACC2HI81_DALPE|nr:hypothetical protein DPEC_G00029370 [Dallia pectoralis]
MWVLPDANRGAWHDAEMKRLLETMQDHLKASAEPGGGSALIRKDKMYKDIPWSDGSRRVKTRHRDQCRNRWMGYINHKMADAQSAVNRAKSFHLKVNLIKGLNALQVEDSADIDWVSIANAVGDITPSSVQNHYYKLRVSKVPSWQTKSFCEIIDYLYTRVLPQFEEVLQQIQMEFEETGSGNHPQEFFLLSEIFDNEDN